VAFGLVFEAQAQGEPCGWVVSGQGSFFPPDAAAGGVDLAALAVIFAPGAQAAARVADKLLRSGAFGVVILDLGQHLNMPMPLQSRLAALAQEYQSVLLCLTQKGAQTPSLSSLVSLRGQTHRCALNNGHFECRVQIIKDKHGGPGWVHKEVCRATSGLC
jgi:recombination protein RecA